MGDKTPSELIMRFQGASLSAKPQTATAIRLDIENSEVEARSHTETHGGDGSIRPDGLLSHYKKLSDDLDAKDP